MLKRPVNTSNWKLILKCSSFPSSSTFTFVVLYQIFRRKHKLLLPFVLVEWLRLNLTSIYNYVCKKVILANSTWNLRLQKLDVSHLSGLYKNNFLFSNIILPFLVFLYNCLAICFVNPQMRLHSYTCYKTRQSPYHKGFRPFYWARNICD